MPAISSIRLYEARIPFKSSFKHGAAERSETESVFVEVLGDDGTPGYGEGCPRSYVTGESIATSRRFFKDQAADILRIGSLGDLKEFCRDRRPMIDADPAAWCAIELAILDLLARARGRPVESLLDLVAARNSYQYSAVIGDCSPEAFHHLYQAYRRQGFADFKIKLSDNLDKDLAKLACMDVDADEIRVRADANNLWPTADTALAYLSALNFRFNAIEEPISSKDVSELREIGRELGIKVILDESFLNIGHVSLVSDNPACWIVNARVSKFGGILRSLELIDEIGRLGIEIIVGAQVGESSLLTRAALVLADAAGEALLAQEGAFSDLLLQRDPIEPKIQFGREGKLSAADLSFRENAGLGLVPVERFDVNTNFSSLEAIGNPVSVPAR